MTGEEAERDRPRIPRAVELPLLLVVALALSLVVRANVAQAFYIPSGSMEPQLEVGDRVLVSRTSYRLHDVHRGDVVVFPSPDGGTDDDQNVVTRIGSDLLEALAIKKPDDDELIKRVIGLPGETIGAQDGTVVIDSRHLVEPYLSDEVVTQDFGPVTVPEGEVFVMGDNRGNSSDSRVIGTIDIDTIVGRAIGRIWPPDRWAFL
ncbi:MAG: signal peptidase I [Acidimicrobiales bacterium]